MHVLTGTSPAAERVVSDRFFKSRVQRTVFVTAVAAGTSGSAGAHVAQLQLNPAFCHLAFGLV